MQYALRIPETRPAFTPYPWFRPIGLYTILPKDVSVDELKKLDGVTVAYGDTIAGLGSVPINAGL